MKCAKSRLLINISRRLTMRAGGWNRGQPCQHIRKRDNTNCSFPTGGCPTELIHRLPSKNNHFINTFCHSQIFGRGVVILLP